MTTPPPARRQALRTGAGIAAAAALTGTGACAPPGPPATKAAPAITPAPSRTTAPTPTGTAPASPRAHPGLPAQIAHGPRTRPRVALTFHGQGDPALAEALLRAAERGGARVTVLAVGDWLDAHPALARRILDGGHELGNHTQRHLAVNDLPEAEAYAEIEECARRLRRLTGSIGTWFRPSRAPAPPRSSSVWPAVRATRTCCRTTSTRSTTPTRARTPSPARSSTRSAPVPW